jgi:hypothetical protein
MLKEKAAGLGYLVAFFSAYFIHLNDVIDVINNVFAGKRLREHIIIMGKDKTHLLCVIADSAFGIMLRRKHVEHLLQGILCLQRQGYLAVLIFFS